MTTPISETELNQTDYLQLFMQELTYQDPLQPIDNREFMAQMAQFSSLQVAKTTNDNLVSLLAMTSANQALSLLGKTVTIPNDEQGKVTKVQFFAGKSPQLTVITANGQLTQVELNEINETEL